MGQKPLRDDDEGSPDLRPAPRLVHRRCDVDSFPILTVNHAFDRCRPGGGRGRGSHREPEPRPVPFAGRHG